jgi:hypothetical protein
MADFRTDTSAIKVDSVKPMSLADMLNIGKQSLELSKIKELYPSIISEQEAKSKTAQIQANVAEQTQNPTIAKAGSEALKSQLDTNTAHFNNIIKNGSDLLTKPNLTKEDIIQRYTEIHKNGPNADNPVALKQALMGLPEKGSATDYKKFIIANMGKTLDSQSQFEKMFPAVSLTDVGGKIVPVTTGNPYVAAIPPGVPTGEGIEKGIAPQLKDISEVTGTVINGKFVPLGETPQETEKKPITSTTPVKEKPELITGETKVLSAGGVPQLNELQKKAYERAEAEKANFKELSENVKEADKTVQTALDKLSASKASAPGRMVRSAGKWLAGNEDLDILTKSLADLSVRQSKLMGAGTDAANEAVSKTQGNADLTEGGLRSILQRVSATNTAFQQYMKASSAYEKSRGLQNANVNHAQFKKAWASNYDTNVFILQNIHDSNLPETQKQLEISKLFKGMSASEIEKFRTKAKNIDALMKGEYK